jgi:quercetin dioxygenase-like cupin family protein
MEKQRIKPVSINETDTTVEMMPGIYRTTKSFNETIMLCHFQFKKGAEIPLHNHDAVQTGYVISGKMKLFKGDGSSFIGDPGSGWVFNSNEPHGAEALEDSEVIECFSPMRPEYMDS